jgi:hypothetical protein
MMCVHELRWKGAVGIWRSVGREIIFIGYHVPVADTTESSIPLNLYNFYPRREILLLFPLYM